MKCENIPQHKISPDGLHQLIPQVSIWARNIQIVFLAPRFLYKSPDIWRIQLCHGFYTIPIESVLKSSLTQ